MSKKLTTEDFIERARAVHGDKYDYSKVVYTRAKDKVEIACHEHGAFMQRAGNHLLAIGCPKCGISKNADGRRKTTASFVEDAIAVHGDKYDYAKVVYVGCDDKVEITCRQHGAFMQSPSNHMQGQGCNKCANNARNSSRSAIAKDTVMERIADVHGDLYLYDKFFYSGASKKSVITCREHGSFMQPPDSHLQGNGCPKCAGRNKTTTEWVADAVAVHGNKYDYSRVLYVHHASQVEIACPEHGSFMQTPNCHLSGAGCPRCPFNYDQPTKLYLLTNGEQIKVGIALDVERRMKQQRQSGQPFTSDLVATWTLPDHPSARAVESKVHKLLSDHNAGLTGFDGATEWFNVSPQVAAETIKQHLP